MSAEKKKELQVAALENGTAIDHIPPSQLFKVAKLLGLENMDNTITIGNNFHSNKMGCKGMIKISDKFFCDEEINRIALIAPNVILNIIRDYEVVEKKTVTLHNRTQQKQITGLFYETNYIYLFRITPFIHLQHTDRCARGQ